MTAAFIKNCRKDLLRAVRSTKDRDLKFHTENVDLWASHHHTHQNSPVSFDVKVGEHALRVSKGDPNSLEADSWRLSGADGEILDRNFTNRFGKTEFVEAKELVATLKNAAKPRRTMREILKSLITG